MCCKIDLCMGHNAAGLTAGFSFPVNFQLSGLLMAVQRTFTGKIKPMHTYCVQSIADDSIPLWKSMKDVGQLQCCEVSHNAYTQL